MDRSDKTTPRIRGTMPETEQAARQLRRAMTAAERSLWLALKGRQVGGLRFRRQHPIGPFILDFCCPARKLVVEVDGPIHSDPDQASHDDARTEHLAAYGYRVLRFSNEEVLEELPAVLACIRAARDL